MPEFLRAAPQTAPADRGLGFPLSDLHVHLDNSSIDQVLPLSRERGVRFGIVEHAGTRENKYPVVLSNDEELLAYIRMLEGQGVYRGVQTEWTDWVQCFSRQALARLDYILTDAMTFPGKDGSRVKLWEPGVEERVEMADRETFMDRFVDWHVQILSTQPIDILANVSWLPAPLTGEGPSGPPAGRPGPQTRSTRAADPYDHFWTETRIRKVIDTAVKHRVAIEISSGFNLPRLKFLRIAKEAGVKFTFGSNGRYPRMGILDYSIALARELKLKPEDMFTPAPDGQKAVQRRIR
jgi:hypothetical protein